MIDINSLLDNINRMEKKSTNLVGKEQIQEISALRKEIESLKAQLREKDDQIKLMVKNQEKKDKYNKSKLNEINDSVTEIISNIMNENKKKKKNLELIEQLGQIFQKNEIVEKINLVVNYFKNTIKQQQENINILCNTLNSHISFLTELASSSDCQSVYFANPWPSKSLMKEKVFELNETSKNILIEQADLMSQFIKEISTKDLDDSPMGEIKDIFNLQLEPQQRSQKIKSLLEGDNLGFNELNSLLIQEVFLTNVLRKYATSLKTKLTINEKEKKKQEKIGLDVLNKLISLDNENDLLMSNQDYEYSFKKLMKKVLSFVEWVETITKISGFTPSEIPSGLQKLVQNQKRIEDLERIHIQDRTLLIKQSSTISKLKEKYKELEKEGNSIQSKEWLRWAKDLYFSITNIRFDDLSDGSIIKMRIAIEEAALTSVGHNKLKKGHSFISSNDNIKDFHKTKTQNIQNQISDQFFESKVGSSHFKDYHKNTDDEEEEFHSIVSKAISAVRLSERK